MNPIQQNHRIICGIETSCDETSVSLIEAEGNSGTPARYRVLAHLVHSQTALHEPFGGVVPEVAARDHLAKLPAMARQAFLTAGLEPQNVTHIAVTAGPGLIGAVMVGYLFAQGFAEATGATLLAINHVDAHLAPATLCTNFNPEEDLGVWLKTRDAIFPRLSLTVSGGHCLLSYDENPFERKIIGTTLDDACGEAFDKVAKLLSLPYPGGPEIEKRALKSQSSNFSFAKPLAGRDDFAFSFSGLKTSVLRATEEQIQNYGPLQESTINDLCASFQERALGHLCDRLCRAEKFYGNSIKEIVIAGGVAANKKFRQTAAEMLRSPVFFAPLSLCNDNATMIALQALIHATDGKITRPFARYPYAPDLLNRTSAQKLKGRPQ